MKKLLIILLFLLVPFAAQALVIGDIDFKRVPFYSPLDTGTLDGQLLRVHAYPEDAIKIIVILGEPTEMGGVWVTEVRYIKDGELHVYRPSGRDASYNRVAIFKDGEELKIHAHVLESINTFIE